MKKTQSPQRLLPVTALLITVSLLITLAVSCQKKKEAGTGSAPAETVDYSQHETFTVWYPADVYDQYTDYSENPVVWALNRKFNVTLKYEQPVRGTEQQALSLMFGAGEYTDMVDMSQYTGSIQQLYDEGVIINIADYLDYMPNYKRLLETDDGFRRVSYNDSGQILTLRNIADPAEYLWGGLVYRYDLLDKATGGNIRFPSGNDYPKTIDDWEYMLPIFKEYFEAQKVADYAVLILPPMGAFPFGELATSFGAGSQYYLDGAVIKYGAYDDAFYKYLKKMGEWYEKGYIYKDFAGRTDMFMRPNPALVYGGNAAIWFGTTGQFGDVMSLRDQGIIFDVRPIPSPLSTADGITETASFVRNPHYLSGGAGYAFTTVCKNLPKLLSIMDYLYSKEGEYLRAGLTRETGSAENPIYVAEGLQDGYYWMEGDRMVVNPKIATYVNWNFAWGSRLPGLVLQGVEPPAVLANRAKGEKYWDHYPNAKFKWLQNALISRTAEEETVYSTNNVRINDYVNSLVPKFIIGTTPLNDQTWAEFKAQLKNLGIEENIRIQQAAYDRWLKR
jgi:putative aldouronate transport system substrate-binding protein